MMAMGPQLDSLTVRNAGLRGSVVVTSSFVLFVRRWCVLGSSSCSSLLFLATALVCVKWTHRETCMRNVDEGSIEHATGLEGESRTAEIGSVLQNCHRDICDGGKAVRIVSLLQRAYPGHSHGLVPSPGQATWLRR